MEELKKVDITHLNIGQTVVPIVRVCNLDCWFDIMTGNIKHVIFTQIMSCNFKQ